MNKRKLHHQLKFFIKVRPLYIFIIAVFLLALGVIGMRENNLRMVELREQVLLADERNENVEKPLRELREHVHSHMNTDLSSGNIAIKPPIQLKSKYEQLVKQEQQRVDRANREIKEKGERVCAERFPAGGLNISRVDCVADYTRVNTVEPREIPSDLYKFDFISPTWSVDLAGLSLLGSLLFFAIFVTRLVVGWFYKRKL